ncbi:hypothetical protein BJ878DRAFT_411128 [Calycina marina]|uniref:Cyclin-dependent kinase n=1 Tax=Calycina marina TaxID=1763456 RepID=A0A9P8CL21_9HELO|nr:hypothetical protein BJ878DRAFT_411128 [Calycina marina]
MASPCKQEPEVVAGLVKKRVAVSQMARKLQNRLALAQFKTNRGWEDLSLDTIVPKVEEELRLRRPQSSGDILSDSSSSSNASDFHYPNSRALMSSPLKSSIFFSDRISDGGSTGHRKRSYNSFEPPSSSSAGSRKRFRSSPTAGRRNNRQLTQSSPIRPKKQTCFTTSAGPGLSFYGNTPNFQIEPEGIFAGASDDDDDTLPAHSFNHIRSSPPRTPPSCNNRSIRDRRSTENRAGKSGEEGADLLLYLATSPSPANPPRARMQPPSTPPQRNMVLPSSMMTPSAFGNPQTPSQNFDFSDFVNITPSPGQRAWKATPGGKTPASIRTPQTISRNNLTYDAYLPPLTSPSIRDRRTPKTAGLGMLLGGDLNS